MTYEVRLKKSAAKQLKKLNPVVRERIATKIYLLATNPRPPASESMAAVPYYKLRVGDYRIVYTIDNGMLTILIIRIGHRREVYKGL